MSALQTLPFERVLLLKLGINPVVGLLYTDMAIKTRAQGASSFTTKAMTALNFYALGNGYYVVAFSGAEMGTVGDFFYSVAADAIDTQHDQFSVEPLPQNLVIIPPDVCVITGNILGLNANPIADSQVTFRAVNYPLQSGLSILSADKVVARTDTNGNFSARLVRGMTVIVEIERTGIKNQFVVPDASSALLNDLIVFPNT